MSESNLVSYNNLNDVAKHLRTDLDRNKDLILLFAHNGSGKTRASMKYKEQGKEYDNDGNSIKSDTLYFNAFTEDLFIWNNDLDEDIDRYIQLNSSSKFFNGIHQLNLNVKIREFFHNYVDLKFDINYDTHQVRFSKDITENGRTETKENIKISRGEETLFIWCFFLTICQLVIDKDEAYNWVKYIYIDDPISSLDENNAIAIACDLANLLIKTNEDSKSEMHIKTIISTHHSLFFNVLFNEFGRKVKSKRYFLHFNESGNYSLQNTNDTPFFHHIVTISELRKVVESDKIYTYHFNALRSILEKTASFFGYDKIDKCIHGLDDETLFKRALQLFSHGKYSIFDPSEMVGDNKDLFKRIFNGFIDKYDFYFPEIFNEQNQT